MYVTFHLATKRAKSDSCICSKGDSNLNIKDELILKQRALW